LPIREKAELAGTKLLHQMSYTITRYRVRLFVYESEEVTLQEGEFWVALEELEAHPMAAPYRKALGVVMGES
jgi:hypothetical protein